MLTALGRKSSFEHLTLSQGTPFDERDFSRQTSPLLLRTWLVLSNWHLPWIIGYAAQDTQAPSPPNATRCPTSGVTGGRWHLQRLEKLWRCCRSVPAQWQGNALPQTLAALLILRLGSRVTSQVASIRNSLVLITVHSISNLPARCAWQEWGGGEHHSCFCEIQIRVDSVFRGLGKL